MLKYIYDDWNDPKVDKAYKELWDCNKRSPDNTASLPIRKAA